jgi:hypothetical protein
MDQGAVFPVFLVVSCQPPMAMERTQMAATTMIATDSSQMVSIA